MSDPDLPPVVYVSRRARLAHVERVRDALLTAEQPLVVLRWLTPTTPPDVLLEAVRDERVRQRIEQPLRAVADAVRAFSEGMRPAFDRLTVMLRQLGEAARQAGMMPDAPPDDPRARALWLAQHRSTGPGRAPAAQQRRPRVHR